MGEHVKLAPVQRGKKWNLVGLYGEIRDLVERTRPDVLHAWLPEIITLPAVRAASSFGIPVVTSHRISLKYSGSSLKVIRDHLGVLAHFSSQCIVANYSVCKEPAYFRRIYDRHHGTEIMNGLDLDCLTKYTSSRTSDSSRIQLLYAGRISPEKGIDFLVELMSELALARELPVSLTVYGDGPKHYKNQLFRLIHDHGLKQHIHFKGECAAWFRAAGDFDAILFPSTSEGTSNVVLEALAVGIPLIMAESDMASHLVVHRESALVVSPRSVGEWCCAIEELAENSKLRSRLILSGQDVVENFSIDSMASKFQDVYKQVLS